MSPPGLQPDLAGKALGGAGPQQVVDMHDADRTSGFDHKQRGDLGRVEDLQRFADELIGPDRLWAARPSPHRRGRPSASAPMWRRAGAPSVMMPASLPSRAGDAGRSPKPLADICSTARPGHLCAERRERYLGAAVHDITGEFQQHTEPAARMQQAEIDRGEAAAFQKTDRQRVAERKLHQRRCGGGEIVRAGLAGLRQHERHVRLTCRACCPARR